MHANPLSPSPARDQGHPRVPGIQSTLELPQVVTAPSEKRVLLSGEYKLPKTSLLLTPIRGQCQSCETNSSHLSYATLIHREATRDDQC